MLVRSETFAHHSGWQCHWVMNFSCVQGAWIKLKNKKKIPVILGKVSGMQ